MRNKKYTIATLGLRTALVMTPLITEVREVEAGIAEDIKEGKQKIKNLQENLDILLSDKVASESRIKNLETQQVELENEIKELEGRIEQLENKKHLIDISVESNKEISINIDKTIESINIEIFGKKRKIEEILEELGKQNTRIDKIKEDITTINEELAEAKKAAEEAKAAAEKAEKDAEAAKDSAAEAEKEASNAKEAAKKAEEEASNAKDSYSNAQASVSDAAYNYYRAEQKLKEATDKSKEEYNKAKAELEEAKKIYEKVKEEEKKAYESYLKAKEEAEAAKKHYEQFKEGRVLYTSNGVNVRDYHGNLIGYLRKGSVIRGKDLGTKIEIEYNGQMATVYKGLVKQGVYPVYTSYGVNVRNLKGEKIGYINRGELLIGEDMGDHIRSLYKGQEVKLSKAYVEEGRLKEFVSKGVNVRDRSGRLIGKIKSGEKVLGKASGNKINIFYKNSKATIHKNFVK